MDHVGLSACQRNHGACLGLFDRPFPTRSLFFASTIVFMVLLVSSAVRLLQFRRNNARRIDKAKEAAELQANTDIAFAEACVRVSRRYQLTPREGEVLVLLARGRNARHIAEALVISDGTARTHIMHIYQKMGLNSQQVLMDIVDAELRDVMGET